MALDSNAMTDQEGALLPHFTPHPSSQFCGVNIFAEDLSSGAPYWKHPYFFYPLTLVGPILHFLKVHWRPGTFVVLDVYSKKYWWCMIQSCASKSHRLTIKWEVGALLLPFKKGWTPHQWIPGTFGLFWYTF